MKKYVILAAVCWFAVISLVGIILTVYDKRIAGSGKRRIPEATLMTVGLLAFAGAYLAFIIENAFVDKRAVNIAYRMRLECKPRIELIVALSDIRLECVF